MTTLEFVGLHGSTPEEWLRTDALAGAPGDDASSLTRKIATRLVGEEKVHAQEAAAFAAMESDGPIEGLEANPGEDTDGAERG